jgi:hypothetical protein
MMTASFIMFTNEVTVVFFSVDNCGRGTFIPFIVRGCCERRGKTNDGCSQR